MTDDDDPMTDRYANGYPVAGKCKNCGEELTRSDRCYSGSTERILVHVNNYRRACGQRLAELKERDD